ncbi:unnamed protein product [Amoebophrya sp. A120]|nr:unnamed protein product [Amoebophrya sp. A120]|eukprot:GSA120T00014841001.1
MTNSATAKLLAAVAVFSAAQSTLVSAIEEEENSAGQAVLVGAEAEVDDDVEDDDEPEKITGFLQRYKKKKVSLLCSSHTEIPTRSAPEEEGSSPDQVCPKGKVYDKAATFRAEDPDNIDVKAWIRGCCKKPEGTGCGGKTGIGGGCGGNKKPTNGETKAKNKELRTEDSS